MYSHFFLCGSQFTSKQLERLAKKAEKDSEKEQAKVKKVSRPISWGDVRAKWSHSTLYTSFLLHTCHHSNTDKMKCLYVCSLLLLASVY